MRTWKDVVGFEGRYEVSNDGLVRTKPRILKPCAMKNGGHLQVVLGGKSVYPKDNRADNLRWATHAENNFHAYRVNGRVPPSRAAVVGTTPSGSRIRFDSFTDAAKFMGVTKNAISSAVNREHHCGEMKWERA